MDFNYCISNPAFNIAESNNVAGTGGNTTLYKTATKNDFDNRLKPGGTLINITLKGIIPDLLFGYYKNYQVNWIHLMDDISVWPYNTCIFSVSKIPRHTPPAMLGGLASKIYSYDKNKCFPFVYYSGSNNGMDKHFSPEFPLKVVRQLPGRNRDSFEYANTNKHVESGPKFAFTVLESRKSYTVTSEPIYGGTICYIPFSTEEEAYKMKLFVENNSVFAEYVKRMNFKGHAFGLRNVKKFDINQINTGSEIPKEWGILDSDLVDPVKLENKISEDRSRVKALGEVFTPTSLVEKVLDLIEEYDPTAFKDPNSTFIDSMCGDGQFLVGIKNRRINNGLHQNTAMDTVYGIDLTQDNIDTCLKRTAGLHSNVVLADSFSNTFTKNELVKIF